MCLLSGVENKGFSCLKLLRAVGFVYSSFLFSFALQVLLTLFCFFCSFISFSLKDLYLHLPPILLKVIALSSFSKFHLLLLLLLLVFFNGAEKPSKPKRAGWFRSSSFSISVSNCFDHCSCGFLLSGFQFCQKHFVFLKC